jgi:hypothetical protein
MQSLAKSGESFEELTRRVKERARRERLHREIGALKTKLAKVLEQRRFNWYVRSRKLLSKIKRLEGDLRQPSLFL